MSEKTYIDRPPRIQPDIPEGEMVIPGPPNLENSAAQSIIQMFLPMITIMGYLLLGIFGRGRSLTMMIPMGLSVLASVGYSLYSRREGDVEKEEKKAAYREKLIEMRQAMQNSHDLQKRFYLYNYPNPNDSLAIIKNSLQNTENRKKGRPAMESRLWERRTHDRDFGSIRLGLGSRPSSQQFKIQGDGSFEDPLMREALRLRDDATFVEELPITIPLRNMSGDDEVNTAKHAIGIVGQPEDVYPFINSTLLNFATFHSPTDTQFFVMSQIEAERKWLWALQMPHFNQANPDFSMCFEPQIEEGEANPDDGTGQISLFLKNIKTILDERELRRGEKGIGDVTLPHIILFVDLLHGRKENSVMNKLENDMTISTIIQRGHLYGASVIFFAPNINDVPSGCSAVIEITKSKLDHGRSRRFRYIEVGVNSRRYVGEADGVDSIDQLEIIAQEMNKLDIRKSYGTDIPRGVMMMDMVGCSTIEQLKEQTKANWRHSRVSENSDWLKMKLGMLSSGEYRKMKFSADADGVHGMIAGSTGSGKSELLMTMILELALNYDPSIMNFVLVDFKGGGAFKPLETLPHVVDVVTNLEGSAVDRMFAAITAELNRRQAINTETNSKDLVDYRSKGLHEQPGNKKVSLDWGDGSVKVFEPKPYPHLFVFIDEFAEMVAENAEYKAQLNSITRLGRALGVTLILAAQRPAGAVTDQMRANIKFRICLRVETREDSSEILRRPEAAFLPTGIPGRGYLQVGNESLELVQVAWSGADYNGGVITKKPDVIWLDREKKEEESGSDKKSIKVFEAMVNMVQELFEEEQRPRQATPWPDFLPRDLSLQSQIDTSYMSASGLIDLLESTEDELPAFTPLNPHVEHWLIREGGWQTIDWSQDAMRAIVGIVDNAFNAEQFPLMIDFRKNGHLVLFGASGFGKTTFLRTLLTTLAVTHSPADLHAYVLDFAGGQMNIFQNLPHVGSVISADQNELVTRLIRKIMDEIDRRKEYLRAEESVDDVYTWNALYNHEPSRRFPAILLMVDNFAEFKENYEELIPAMISIVREGRAFGIHVVLAAEQSSGVSGKLYGLFNQRLTLKLSDETEYMNVVGRGARGFGEIEGRGYIRYDRQALEFQTALPVGVANDAGGQKIDITKQLSTLIDKLIDYDSGLQPSLYPEEIKPLPEAILLSHTVFKDEKLEGRFVTPPIAIDDRTLLPWKLNLTQQGPHMVVIGPPNSGKTTTLRTLTLSLAENYKPEDVQIVLVDYQKRFMNYGGLRTLGELPHVIDSVDDAELISDFVDNLVNEGVVMGEKKDDRALFVIIDNFSDFSEEVEAIQRTHRATYLEELSKVARKSGTDGIHFIICGGVDLTRINNNFRKRIASSRFGIGLQVADSVAALNGKPPRGLAETEPPPGRGFAVKAGRVAMLQIATPYQNLEEMPHVLDAEVERISQLHAGSAEVSWSPRIEKEKADDEDSEEEAVASKPKKKKEPQVEQTKLVVPTPVIQKSVRGTENKPNVESTAARRDDQNFRTGVIQIDPKKYKHLDIEGYKKQLLEKGFIDDFGASVISPDGLITLAIRKKIVTEEELDELLRGK